jgi:hypothetical protein
MSFWFHSRNKAARRSLHSVSVPLFALPALAAAIAFLVLTTLRGCL